MKRCGCTLREECIEENRLCFLLLQQQSKTSKPVMTISETTLQNEWLIFTVGKKRKKRRGAAYSPVRLEGSASASHISETFQPVLISSCDSEGDNTYDNISHLHSCNVCVVYSEMMDGNVCIYSSSSRCHLVNMVCLSPNDVVKVNQLRRRRRRGRYL